MMKKTYKNAEIYGKPNCPHCENAKHLCRKKGIEYLYKELGTDFDGQYMLDKFPNARTFPQIIVDGNHVGGYDDLSKLIGDT